MRFTRFVPSSSRADRVRLRSSARSGPRFETLEPRLLLSATPIVSAFESPAPGEPLHGDAPPERPVLLVPGATSTLWADGQKDAWLTQRGIAPDKLEADPLLGAMQDIRKSLEGLGYTPGTDLFTAVHDWRLAPAPSDGTRDGVVSGLSGDTLTDAVFQHGVDYLGYWLDQARAAWEAEHGAPPASVDVVAHSTGGLAARAYLQADSAYGATYTDANGTEHTLPQIENLAMVGVPHRGMSKAWNPLQDRFGSDVAFRVVVAGALDEAYGRMVDDGVTLEGPTDAGDLTASHFASMADDEARRAFIDAYVPGLRGQLATYPFLVEDPETGSDPVTVNDRPAERNEVLLDLNAGLDVDFFLDDSGAGLAYVDDQGDPVIPAPGPNDFADRVAGNTTVVFNDAFETPTRVNRRLGPVDGQVDRIAGFDALAGSPPERTQTWYEDLARRPGEPEPAGSAPTFPGDRAVPRLSARDPFVGESRVTLAGVSDTGFGHGTLPAHPEAQAAILETLGFTEGTDFTAADLSTGRFTSPGDEPFEMIENLLETGILEPGELPALGGVLGGLRGDFDHVIDTSALESEAADAYRSLLSAGSQWMVSQVAAEAPLATELPLVGRSIGELIQVDSLLDDLLFEKSAGLGATILDAIDSRDAGAFAQTLAGRLAAAAGTAETIVDPARSFGGLLPAGAMTVPGGPGGDQLVFNAGFTMREGVARELALPPGKADQAVRLQGAEAVVEVAVHADLTLGYRLDAALADDQRPFLRVNDLSIDADLALENVDFDLALGLLGASIDDGTLTLAGDVDVTLHNPDGDAAGRVTVSELDGTAAGDLFSLDAASSLDALLPVSASAGDFTAAADARIRLADDDLFDGVDIEPSFEHLDTTLPFQHAQPSDIISSIETVAEGLSRFAGSPVLETPLPFTEQTTVGDALDFGEGVLGSAVDPLLETVETEAGDGSTRTVERAAFATTGELAERLSTSLGVDESVIDIRYETATQELTLHVPASATLPSTDVPFNFGADAGPLGRLAAGGEVSIDAEVDAGFTVGLELVPVEAVVEASSDLPSDGRLAADARFDLAVGGAAPVTVTVAADGGNPGPQALVDDVNAALETAGLATSVAATLEGDRLALRTVGRETAPRLQITAGAADPAVTTLGLPASGGDADSLADHVFIENATLRGALMLGAENLNATGRFGFLGVTADGTDVAVDAAADITLADPATGTAGGRIDLVELFDAVGRGNAADLVTDAGGDSTLTLSSSTTAAPRAEASIPVALNPNLLGDDHPANPEISLEFADLTDPSTRSLSFNDDMDRLLDFQDLSFTDIVTALGEAADFLAQELAHEAALTRDLPLVGASVSDLLDFAGDFAGRLEDFESNPTETLDRLETAIESGLGLSPEAVTLTLESDLLRFDLDIARSLSPAVFDGEAEDANGNGRLDPGEDLDSDGVLDRGAVNLSFDLAEAVANAGGNSHLDLSGAEAFVDVSGSGDFSFEAGSSLDLDLGIDLSDPQAPAPVIFDTSEVALEAKAEGTGLDTSVALGPLGIFLRDGVARLDDGTGSHGPAHFTYGLDDAPADPGLPAGARRIADLGVSDFSFTCAAGAHADLPLYFPTENDALSPNLTLDIADLCDPANTTSVSGPDLTSLAENLDLSGGLDAMLDGLDLLLGEIQKTLGNEVFSQRIPLVGDQLSEAADFIGRVRDGVLADLRAASDFDVANVQQALFDALGSPGLGWLGDTNSDGSVDVNDIDITPDNPDASTDEVRFDILLAPTVNVLSSSIGFDLGIPALALEADGEVAADLDFELDLGLGVSRTDGVFFDTSAMDELTASLNVTLPGFAATGNLAFLQVELEDRGSDPSSVGVDFTVDLQDPGGNDGRLTMAELTGGGGGILDASLSGGADVNLDLVTSFGGSAEFPSIHAGLDVDWMFDTGDLAGSEPTLSFHDIQLDAGEFLSDLAGPVLEEIQRITGPIAPIVDVLNAEVPLVNEKLIDLAVQAIPGVDADVPASGFLDAFASVIDLVNNVPSVGGDVRLDLGSFVLDPDGVDFRTATNLPGLDLGQALDTTLPGANPLQQMRDISGDVADFFDEADDPGGSGQGFAFPLLEEPLQAFGLLLGQDVDLVTYDMAPLEMSLDFSLPLPPVPAGPVTVRFELGGGVSAKVDLGFGYDTRGFRLFSQTGEPGDLAAGFYVSDRENADGTGEDVNEAELSGRILAGGAVGIGIVDVGVRGGLEATLGADLRDSDGDGRVHANEFIATAEEGLACTFELGGTVDMIVDVFASLAGTVDVSARVVETTLAEFGFGGEPCFNGRFESNDTFAAAADLGAGPGIHVEGATISAPSDKDWLKFDLPRADSVDVTTRFDHSDANLDLELYDADRNLLGRSASTGDDETVTLENADAGTYYALVVGDGPEQYALEVEPAASSATEVYYVNSVAAGWSNEEDEGFYTLAAGDDAHDGASPTAPKETLAALTADVDLGPNDLVVLETGTYGPLTLTAEESGSTWFGAVTGSTIRSRTGDPAVTLDGAEATRLDRLTLDGDLGARLTGAATGNTLRSLTFDTHVTGAEITGAAADNMLRANTFIRGVGLIVSSHDAGPDPTGNTIEANTFDELATAIRLDGAGTQTVTANTIDGAQTGIEVTAGTGGTVQDNTLELLLPFTGGSLPPETTGIQIGAGAEPVIRDNTVRDATTGIDNASSLAVLDGNRIEGHATGLTGSGILGAPSAGQANTFVDNTTGIEIPAGIDGQRVQHNTIRASSTGILDQRTGGRFGGAMPIFFPPTDVDGAALAPNLTELAGGASIDPTATVVAARAEAFVNDRPDLVDVLADGVIDGRFDGLEDDPTNPLELAWADRLWPAGGSGGTLDSFHYEVPATELFDAENFTAAVSDQLTDRGTSEPLAVRDVTFIVESDIGAHDDKLDAVRAWIDGAGYFGDGPITLSGEAIRGLRPARVTGNTLENNDVGIETGATIGGVDHGASNRFTGNTTGVEADAGAEIRFNRFGGNDVGVEAFDDVRVHHNVITGVGGDEGVPDDAGILLRFDNADLEQRLNIRHNTVVADHGDAVRVNGRFNGAVEIENNILWARGGTALAVDVDDRGFFLSAFESDHNNLYATDGGHVAAWKGRAYDDLLAWRIDSGFDRHSIGRTGPDPMRDAPRFLDRAGGDLHLAADSSSIDAGAPGADARGEGGGGGGRANLGAFGNTAEATSSPARTLRLESHRLYQDWPRDRHELIRWHAHGVDGEVDIDIIDAGDGTKAADVAVASAEAGEAVFTPGEAGLPADASIRYQVRVRSVDDPAVEAVTDEWFVVPDATDTFFLDDGSNDGDVHTPGAAGDPRNPGTSPGAPKASLFGFLDGGRVDEFVLESFDFPYEIDIVDEDTTSGPVGIHERTSADPTPPLTGWVDNPDAVVRVSVDGQGPFRATNLGDGSWELGGAALAPLETGPHDVMVTAGVDADTTQDELTIVEADGFVVPDGLSTDHPAPDLHGTIADPSWEIMVRGGTAGWARAEVAADGTWTVPGARLQGEVFELLARPRGGAELAGGKRLRIDTGTHRLIRTPQLDLRHNGIDLVGVGDGTPRGPRSILDRGFGPTVWSRDTLDGVQAVLDIEHARDVTVEGLGLEGAQTLVRSWDGAASHRLTIRGNLFNLASDAENFHFVNRAVDLWSQTRDARIVGNRFESLVPDALVPDATNQTISATGPGTLIENNRIESAGGVGIDVINRGGIRVIGNTVTGVDRGIDASSSDVLVQDNHVFDVADIGIHVNGADAIGNHVHEAPVGIEVSSNNGRAEGNLVHDGEVGIRLDFGLARDNRVYDQREVGIEARGGGGTFVENNHVYATPVGIEATGQSDDPDDLPGKISGNLVYQTTDVGIDVRTVDVDETVINNTVNAPGGVALRLEPDGDPAPDAVSGVKLYNNLLVAGAEAAVAINAEAADDFQSNRNLFHATGQAVTGRFAGSDQATLADWQNASGADADSVAGAPGFADPDGVNGRSGYDPDRGRDFGADDDYRLTAGSPAIDRGRTLESPRLDRLDRRRHDDPATANRGPGDRYVETVVGASPFDAVGTAQTLVSDDSATLVDLPFTFDFHGTGYDRVAVSSNGFLQFSGIEGTFSGPESAQQARNSIRRLASEARIAPLFDDLDITPETQFGLGQARVFIDEWTPGAFTVRWEGHHEASRSRVNASVTLSDGGGIRFDYGEGNFGLSPTVGISAGDGEVFTRSIHDGSAGLGPADSVTFETRAGIVDLGAHEFGGPAGAPLPVGVWIDRAGTSAGLPRLFGAVDAPGARVRVDLPGRAPIYSHSGFHDGVWNVRTARAFSRPLPDGVYDVDVAATLGDQRSGTDRTRDELTIRSIAPRVTVDRLTTGDGTPVLTGTVSDPDAVLTVDYGGFQPLEPVSGAQTLNRGDGTWRGQVVSNFLTPPLADGVYEVEAVASIPTIDGLEGTDHTRDELVIGDARIGLTVASLDTADTTPALSGEAPADMARIDLYVDGQGPHPVAQDGQGGWSLADDTLDPVTPGAHEVTLIGYDGADTLLGADSTTAELTIAGAAPNRAPQLRGANPLPVIASFETANPGATLASILDRNVIDADGPVRGAAIVAADETNGTWQFDTDGTGFTDLPEVSATDAWLLAADGDTRVRFVPDPGFSGRAGLRVRAWDGSGGRAEGTRADASAGGGSRPFSRLTAGTGIRVTEQVVAVDIDGSGGAEAATDGLMIARHLFGFSGTAVTDGALAGSATRVGASAVTDFFGAIRDAILDVDGNGVIEPLTDGILLSRYLAGFSGAELVAGAVGEGAARGSPEAILRFLAPFDRAGTAAEEGAEEPAGPDPFTAGESPAPPPALLASAPEAGSPAELAAARTTRPAWQLPSFERPAAPAPFRSPGSHGGAPAGSAFDRFGLWHALGDDGIESPRAEWLQDGRHWNTIRF